MRIAYCSWSATDWDFDECLPAIAKIGYTGVELAVNARFKSDLYTFDATRRARLRELLAQYNLALVAVGGQTPLLVEDPEKHAVNLKRLRDSIDLAADLRQEGRTPIMVSLLGGHEDDWGRLKNMIVDRVSELGEHAASREVIFAAEMHCGMAMDIPRKAVWMVEQVNSPWVKLNFDMSHCEIAAIPMEECIPQMVPHSVFTHVKDQKGIYPYHEFLTPGSGPFDMVKYVKLLHESGYTGFIGMEVSVAVQRQPGYDPLVDANLGYWAIRHGFCMSGAALDA